MHDTKAPRGDVVVVEDDHSVRLAIGRLLETAGFRVRTFESAEALLVGAADLLELEPFEIGAFPRHSGSEASTGQIVLFETVPGGAGYAEEMVRRLPEVAEAAPEEKAGRQGTAVVYCKKTRGRISPAPLTSPSFL